MGNLLTLKYSQVLVGSTVVCVCVGMWEKEEGSREERREGAGGKERGRERENSCWKKSLAHHLIHSRHTISSIFPSFLFPSKKTHSCVAWRVGYSDFSNLCRFTTAQFRVTMLVKWICCKHCFHYISPYLGPLQSEHHAVTKVKTPLPTSKSPIIYLS